MSQRIHYLFDRIVITKEAKPLYTFKIKGGVYGDWNKARNEDVRRTGNKIGMEFYRTQAEYNGYYE